MNAKNTATRTAPTAGPHTNTSPKHAARTALAQVVMTSLPLEDLVERVADAVVERLAQQTERQLDRDIVGPVEMARRLDISRTTLHRLRLDGCPAVRLGDVYKYEPGAVLTWLKNRGAK